MKYTGSTQLGHASGAAESPPPFMLSAAHREENRAANKPMYDAPPDQPASQTRSSSTACFADTASTCASIHFGSPDHFHQLPGHFSAMGHLSATSNIPRRSASFCHGAAAAVGD